MVAAKLAEFHFFETGLARRQLELMRKAAAASPDVSHVLAMHAALAAASTFPSSWLVHHRLRALRSGRAR